MLKKYMALMALDLLFPYKNTWWCFIIWTCEYYFKFTTV